MPDLTTLLAPYHGYDPRKAIARRHRAARRLAVVPKQSGPRDGSAVHASGAAHAGAHRR
ncbi:MAG TPA: hypothetical protein VF049_11010 [Nocardioidaceae bacterium]|jgi:hypothetical protein